MRRFLSTLVLDGFVQARNQLYAIGLGMAVAWGLLARFVVDAEVLRPWLAPILIVHLGSTTYFFMAALIIFERDQGTLSAQSITPLRFHEYLASKLTSLSVFAAVESLLLLALAGALAQIHWPALFWAIAVLGMFYGLLGFIQALPCRSVTDFLIPNAMVMGILLMLPLLPYFGVWPGYGWFLFPTYAPFLLLVAATVGLPAAQTGVAVVVSVLWLMVGFRWAGRVYGRLRQSSEVGARAEGDS